LRRILAVNLVHRFHHLGDPVRGDVNFGLFFTIWDRLLGTYYAGTGDRALGPAEIGVFDRPDYPVGYIAQLVEPFQTPQRGAAS
jgi:sterol desaturase/sphingolipid hydroxylase (fatty acid hydroxylase superfamily)